MVVSFNGRTKAFFGALVLTLVILPVVLMEPAGAYSCAGVRVPGGASIQGAINQHAAGTTFCLSHGRYNVSSPIRPKDRDRFVGAAWSRRGVIVRTRSSEVIFELDGTANVTFRHFSIKGARNACPGQNCGETGRAISRGSRVTVIRMHLFHNGLNAIGGTTGLLTVKHTEIDHNGSSAGDGVSAGIKSLHSLSVSHSNIHDNLGNGLWCDIQCGDFTVIGSRIKHNSASGIFDEISQGTALFRSNIIKRNNTVGDGFRGGLSITNSKNVVAYNNVFKRNRGFGIAARMDGRVHCGNPDSECGYVVANVTIHHNVFHHDSVVGCKLTGVHCAKNRR
jgi:Right handed beta helix region